MRNREQRLRWIEQLIGAKYQDDDRENALAFPTARGTMAVTFPSIVEVVPASQVQPFALLPKEFCGVLHRGTVLAPILDTDGNEGTHGHVVLVEGAGCVFGLKFNGTPSVVDLEETPHAPLAIEYGPVFPSGVLPVLDIDAVAKALLALD